MQTTSTTEGTTTTKNAWTIDASHTNATFSVRHLMISNVRGEFQKVSGTVTFDPAKPEATKINAEIDVSSISTREPQRDAHHHGQPDDQGHHEVRDVPGDHQPRR
jgi:polyisoprenoid-binding protein YceI